MKPAALLLVAFVALPAVEVALHVRARAAVPAEADWREAAAFVRSQLEPRDLITSAPRWTDPHLRAVLGDRIDAAMAGRSDTAAYARLWVLGIRGARAPEASGTPQLERRFGRVTVERFALAPPAVRDDLVQRVAAGAAEVAFGARACRYGEGPLPRGGGLGVGVLPPRERYQCDGAGNWVAAVVLEDLAIRPRHCVYQPPGVGRPTRVVLRDVPLSEQLVFYGGLYYEHERMRQGAPVVATVLANGRALGALTHRDGEGWVKRAWTTQPGRADVAIEVAGTSRKQRAFCWAASVRGAP